MKTQLGIALLCAGLMGGCATRRLMPTEPAMREHLVGAWRLVSWEARTEGQTNFPFGADASGLLIYSASGRMSVFLSQSKENVSQQPKRRQARWPKSRRRSTPVSPTPAHSR